MSLHSASDGRAASIARRRALSAGKPALAQSNAAPPSPPSPQPSQAPQATHTAPPAFSQSTSTHNLARARRAALSLHGRGNTPAAPPTRAPKPSFTSGATPPPTSSVIANDRDRVTASRVGIGSQVTGMNNVRFGSGLAERGTSQKVGFARTEGGLIVSGTLVRSGVRITGDEAGAEIVVTGEAEQRPEDDLTERQNGAGRPQFARNADPHGASVFSRRPARHATIETSNAGLPVTGTALGTSSRVTGDEALVRRNVTGNQYIAPNRGAATDLGTRPDPVSGAKVAIGFTHGQQRVTGIAVEADHRVTGDGRPACACITGSQYGAPPAEPAPARERGFSVRTPHHSSQPHANASSITGSFASGGEKVTGNREFFFKPRKSAEGAVPARLRVSGEGSTAGHAITGSAWTEHSNVTGAEGAGAGIRNPSERAGKPQSFAGARHFKAMASREDPRHLVTGMAGFSSDTGARVTLSGGAQG